MNNKDYDHISEDNNVGDNGNENNCVDNDYISLWQSKSGNLDLFSNLTVSLRGSKELFSRFRKSSLDLELLAVSEGMARPRCASLSWSIKQSPCHHPFACAFCTPLGLYQFSV